LKRSLHVVHDSGEPPAQAPWVVAVEGTRVSIADTGDGVPSLRFVDLLVHAGAACLEPEDGMKADMRVVIRGTPNGPEARLRAEVMEKAADVVLGSVRPAFARLFTSACARWVNS
jgi:hypothetical protein